MRVPVVGMVVTALIIATAACNDDGNRTDGTDTSPGESAPDDATATTERPDEGFATRPGVDQIAILDALPGEEIDVFDDDGNEVATGVVDDEGSLLFRGIDPGDYTVGSEEATTGTITVPSAEDVPDDRFYERQELEEGFGYIRVRDNTTLSANVILPEGEGPFPTVVEYSAFAPSDPEQFGFGNILPQLGYAYVGVNMRGSGCSGGSWRFFEAIQATDGYDVIETLAAQEWVDGDVGMVGQSYAGISQLFVAHTQPPSLAAISPLSVFDDAYNSTLYPGGILNDGFAVQWVDHRLDENAPDARSWVTERIEDEEDVECEENQRLRLQNSDLVTEIEQTPFYDPAIADPLAPRRFADRIDVPVFIAGAWQDERTGARFATMLDRFDSAPNVYVSLVNGLHADSISSGVIPRIVEFLDLYVAREVPDLEVIRGVAPALAQSIFGTDDVAASDDPRFEDRFRSMDYDEALAEFESEPPIEVLFENGAAEGYEAGTPNARFSRSYDEWPIPSVSATSMYLGDASLRQQPGGPSGATSYVANPNVRPATFFAGESAEIWRPDPQWDWRPNPPETAASFVSRPLAEPMAMIGSASADLWIRTDATDTDLEVTISEIRPDGTEMYVQSGWLRASHATTLDSDASTALRPVHTHLEEDAEELTAGEPSRLRVEIFPFGHIFRKDSRLRVTVDAPGNNRALWEFDSISDGEDVEILHGPKHPSKIVLPVDKSFELDDEYEKPPRCDAVRGQPCRAAPDRFAD